MILGFTGSRRRVTDYQRQKMELIIGHPSVTELHHGDCVEADALAHQIALRAGKHIVIHPPINPKYRAWCMAIDCEWWPEKEYTARNRDIVRCTEVLLAIPDRPEVLRGSGTWNTIRIGRSKRQRNPSFRIRRVMPYG